MSGYLTKVNQVKYLLLKEIEFNDSENDEIIKDNYNKFKQWLINNGCIISGIEFPIQYSNLNIIGCKTTKYIDINTAMFFIPYHIVINSNTITKYNYFKGIIVTNGLKLTLFLIEEYMNIQHSKWKEYIELILQNDYCVFPVNYPPEILFNLPKELIIKINEYSSEIEEYYNSVKKHFKHYNDKFTFDIFKTFYLFVISRQFYISNQISILVPFADMLNHNDSVDIKYEFFDSENYVMKCTANLDKENVKDNLSAFTKCDSYYQHYNSNNNNIHKVYKEVTTPLIEEEDELCLRTSDYFCISTNKQQVFQQGEQVYNNYGNDSNASLLVNFGFCLINNQYDYTVLTVSLPKNEDNVNNVVDKIAKVKKDIKKNYNVKIVINKNNICFDVKIKHNKINKKLFRILSLLYCDFANNSMIVIIDKIIDILNDAITKSQQTIDIDKSLTLLIEMLNYNELTKTQKINFMITIYQITQQVNLLIQRDYYLILKEVIYQYEINNKPKHNINEIIEQICANKHSEYIKSNIIKNNVISFINKFII